MSRIYRLSRTGMKVLYKVRHHKGHGIHSPFVFSFINRVIEEKTAYYAYGDIDTYLENFPYDTFVDDKIHKLAFRVTNAYSSKHILELGGGNGLNTLYITSVRSDSHCLSVELNPIKYAEAQNLYREWGRDIVQSSDEFPALDNKLDCIFVNLRNYKVDKDKLVGYLLSNINVDGFIFMDGIRTSKSQQMLWKELVKNDKVVISMDLFEVGILFFDKKYFKRNYKLSF